MKEMLEHPEITWAERTGYPSWAQPKDHDDEDDEDCPRRKKDG